jgi:cytochrome P450
LIQDLSSDRFLEPFDNVWRIKKLFNIGKENRLKKALSIVQEYSMNIIRSRMLKGMELDGREDMLSRFASNKDHNEIVLRDVVISFLLAGRETTSTALTWFFWLVLVLLLFLDGPVFSATLNRAY